MDLRFAFRMIRRAPGFTAVAVLTLALGIGMNTVVFTLYDAVALKPIAARAPGELVRISGRQGDRPFTELSYSRYRQIRGHAHSLSAVIATSDPQTVAGQNEVLHVRLVSGNYFAALGVTPTLGRTFQPDDRTVAIISDDFWRRKLHADPAVLTRTIRLHGTVLYIVGVAPPDFAGTGQPPQKPDLWVPLAAQPEILPGVDWLHDEKAAVWQVLARRAPHVTVQQASAELDVLARSWPLVNGRPAHLFARAATFFQTDTGEFEVFGTVCLVLMVAVGLILLIGSVNLVNLLFARHAARSREFAVRLALGARRFHLLRQLSTESLLLGLSGGLAGFLFSLWACEWIRLEVAAFAERISGGLLGVHLDISTDWRVLAYSAALSVVTGLAIGLWPAVQASRRDVVSTLKQVGAGSPGRRRKRSLLIGAQVAACLTLLAGAGLLFRGAWRSAGVDPGFDVHHLILAGVGGKSIAVSPAARTELFRHAVDRIGAVPEIASVAWAGRQPFLGSWTGDFQNERQARIRCDYNMVSSRYFETLGMNVLEGRTFTPDEAETSAPVVVISELAARAAWPGVDPIARRVSGLGWARRELGHDTFTVIGVVKDIRSTFLSKPDLAALYFPLPLRSNYGWLLLRTRTAPQAAFRHTLDALATVNANLPTRTYLTAMDQAPLEIQEMMAQAPAMVASALGLLALLLAAVGIFGLVMQLVTQRTQEIAVRLSLGAEKRDVVRMIVSEMLRPVLLGAAFGLAGSLGISALLARLLATPDLPDLTYGAGAFDPLSFFGVLALLTATIAAASFLPVHRATRIAPAQALRNE